MKETYLVREIIAPCSIEVEDGIIKNTSKPLSQFINQQFSALQEMLGKQKGRKFILEKVENEVSNGN